jgi:pimeloyl-ACP methyl ester carboxylesterase
VRRLHVDLDRGVRIALLDFGGEGPPALLHHANGFCAAMWGQVAEGLRGRFRLFAMDARGHGDSAKPRSAESYAWHHFGADAGEVADRLAAEHGPLALGLGHSFGGTALTLAALDGPERFARLVLVDPIIKPSGAPAGGASPRGPSLADGARRRRSVFASRGEARERFTGKSFFADWTPGALDLYLAEGLADRPDGRVELKCSPFVEATIFEGGFQLDVMARAPELAVPALVLWARGGNFPRPHFESLASLMQRAEVRTADAGHLVPMERPEIVAEEVLAFSARSGAAAPASPTSPHAATPRG